MPDGGVASVKEGSDSRSHSTSSMRLFSGLEGEMVKLRGLSGAVLGWTHIVVDSCLLRMIAFVVGSRLCCRLKWSATLCTCRSHCQHLFIS